jgi:ribosomal protein S18 acetylase RimI-like enzyme
MTEQPELHISTATRDDAREVMTWFTDAESVMLWGSPFTRFPLREETFFTDTEWEEIASRVARDEEGHLVAFGQFYPKLGRCHLARLVVNPAFRRRGLGVRFIGALMAHGGEALRTDEFSLYVMTANKAAWTCYKKLGFHMEPYPHNDPHLDNCVFMVAERPAP